MAPRQVGSLRRPENSLVDALVKARSDVGREAHGDNLLFFSAFSAFAAALSGRLPAPEPAMFDNHTSHTRL
jgi:hypothetical protein